MAKLLVDLIERPHIVEYLSPASVEQFGEKWYRGRNGYFVGGTSRRKLHRAIYESVFGPIPAGWHVHHVDGNNQNNHFCNLMAVPPDEHAREHSVGKTNSERQKEAASHAIHKTWGRREYVELSCAECGTAFKSRAFEPRDTCSSGCMERRRNREAYPKPDEKRCARCHTPFKPKRRSQIYCSEKCNVASAWARRATKAGPRDVTCACCGSVFSSSRSNAKFCGRKCGLAFHDKERRHKISEASRARRRL